MLDIWTNYSFGILSHSVSFCGLDFAQEVNVSRDEFYVALDKPLAVMCMLIQLQAIMHIFVIRSVWFQTPIRTGGR